MCWYMFTHNAELLAGSQVIHVPESAQPGHSIGLPLLTLSPDNVTSVVFSISGKHSSTFGIGKYSGQLFVKKAVLDYETTVQYKVQVEARLNHCPQCLLSWKVSIIVDDVIDEPPVFSHSIYNATLLQWTPKGVMFLHPKVLDLDQHDTVWLTVAVMEPSNSSNLFAIDHTTQSLVTASQTVLGRYTLLLTATDVAGLSSVALVHVSVIEPSSTEPTLELTRQSITVDENTIPTMPLATLAVPVLQGYSFCTINEPFDTLFHLDNTLRLWLVTELDYEQLSYLNVSITCTDSNEQIVALFLYNVLINNLNDNSPVFISKHFSIKIPENLESNIVKVPVEVFDADGSELGNAVKYFFDPPEKDFVVRFDSHSGLHYITNSHPLDFEAHTFYSLRCWAEDRGGLISDEPMLLNVTVLNVNEHEPFFLQKNYSVIVEQNHTGPIFTVEAKDNDHSDEFGAITYKLYTPYGSNSPLVLNRLSGEVEITHRINFDVQPHYYPGYIVASDKAGRSSKPAMFDIRLLRLSGPSVVSSSANPVTDNGFMEAKYRFQVPENVPVGTIVGKVSCHGCISYSISTPGVPFRVDLITGEIYTTDEMDYETDPLYYNLTLVASDSKTQQQYFTDTAVELLDVNEYFPSFITPKPCYRLNINSDTSVGTDVLVLLAIDKDSGPLYGKVTEYRLVDPVIQGIELPFVIEGGHWNYGARLRLSSPLNSKHSEWIRYIKVVAIDGGGYASEPLRIEMNISYELEYLSSQLEIQLEHKQREIRQTTEEGGQTEFAILLSYKNTTALFDESSPSTLQPLVARFPENSNPGTLQVSIALIPYLNGSVSASNLAASACPDDFHHHQFILKEIGLPFQILKNNDSCEHILTNSEALDYENDTVVYSLTVLAMYSGEHILKEANIRVHLEDRNDNHPTLPLKVYSVSFSENYVGVIFQVQAADDDGSLQFSELSYDLLGDSRFNISADGTIRNFQAFDYEYEDPCFYFNVTATDSVGLQAMAAIEACLVDEDDNCPQFDEATYQLLVVENTPQGTGVHNFTVRDNDGNIEYSSTVQFSFQPTNISQIFYINNNNYELTIRRPLDFESDHSPFSFLVLATDAGNNTCSAEVTVTVANQKDIAPVFRESFRQVSIPRRNVPNSEARSS